MSDPSPSHHVETRDIGFAGIGITSEMRARKLRPDLVKMLANSMRQLGQLCPIVVCPNTRAGYTLIAGRHRLEAARELDWESIRAEIRTDVKGEDILLAEIDENLARGELTPAERAMHIAKRKEIYEARHPETRSTKQGGPGRAKATQSQVATESAPAFIDDTAARTGKHRATVARDASRGDQPDLERVVGTSLDKGDELDALAKLASGAPAVREALIVRAARGEKVSAKTAAKQQRRAGREAELAAKIIALPAKKFGVIYADPEWRFEPWSRETGMDRAADNHYATSELGTIKARDVRSIAADDCVLFLWSTAPMQPQAFEVMAEWGFIYKSQTIWDKGELGTGYWFRNRHEVLLVGTVGAIPAPALGTQWPSIIEAAVGQHSEKPERFYELIEAYFPNLPKIELNARRSRPGWASWGTIENDDGANSACCLGTLTD